MLFHNRCCIVVLLAFTFLPSLEAQGKWQVQSEKDKWSGKEVTYIGLQGREPEATRKATLAIACANSKVVRVRLVADGLVFATDNNAILGKQTAVSVKFDGKQDGHFAKWWYMADDQKSINVPNAILKKFLNSKEVLLIVRDGFETQHLLEFENEDPPLPAISQYCGMKP